MARHLRRGHRRNLEVFNEMGILDPTKVTRLALQNAASVAGLFLTTEASIAEAPKEKVQTPAPGRTASPLRCVFIDDRSHEQVHVSQGRIPSRAFS
jgi:hypothetical protein